MACFITLSINSLSFYTNPNYELSAQDNKLYTEGSRRSPNANNLNYLTFKLSCLLATAVNTSTGHAKRLDSKMEKLTRLQESWRNYPSSETPETDEVNPNREQLSEHEEIPLGFFPLFFGSTAGLHFKPS